MSLLPAGVVTGSTILYMPLLATDVPEGMDGCGVWSWIVDECRALDSLLVATMPGTVDAVFARLTEWLHCAGFVSPAKIQTRDAGMVWVYPFRPGDRPRIVALF